MAKVDNMYLANLAFLLNYADGMANDEVEYELFKIIFQSKESVHYDRVKGAGFADLEQELSNLSTALLFSASLVESTFYLNREKNNNPYIVVGHNDIQIIDETMKKSEEYIVNVQYKLLQDINKNGTVSL
jgi:hypothetical protein